MSYVELSPTVYAAPFDALAYNGMQINGSMEVSQELGTTNRTTNGYVCDGWQFSASPAGLAFATGKNVATPGFPPGFSSFLGVNINTGAAVAAGDIVEVGQSIEGYRISRLSWGTSSAQSITIGFWTNHKRIGTYTVTVRNSPTTQSYCATYTQNVTNTWEYKTVTIPGCTAGTWKSDNTTGIILDFPLAAGATFTAPTANAWNAGTYVAAPGQVVNTATGDNFIITGVVVLPGIEAPSAARSALIMRPFDQELLPCQRYFYNGVPGIVAVAGNTTTLNRAISRHPVMMRATPSLLVVTSAITVFDGTGTATFSAASSNFSDARNLSFDANLTGSVVAGRVLVPIVGSGGNLNVDARL